MAGGRETNGSDMTRYDTVLDIIGMGHLEIKHSNFLAWMLESLTGKERYLKLRELYADFLEQQS